MDRRGSISATPSSSRIPLGKRTASSAGLEAAPAGGELDRSSLRPRSSRWGLCWPVLSKSTHLTCVSYYYYLAEPPATVRRTNLLLQHDLERRLRAAQSRELELQSQLDETKRELDTAKDVNRRLVEDDAWKEEDMEKKRVEQENEKVRPSHSIRAHTPRLCHRPLETGPDTISDTLPRRLCPPEIPTIDATHSPNVPLCVRVGESFPDRSAVVRQTISEAYRHGPHQ